MSEQQYSRPSKPATRTACPNGCGCIGILALNGNQVICPNCGTVNL